MKISSTVLKTSRRGDRPAEFIALHPTKRKITFTDKKGIGEVKLLGKWDVHCFAYEQIKRVRIVRRADGYYCQICVDSDNKKPLPTTGSQIAIDVGLEVFYADSNGNLEPNPRFAKKAAGKVKLKQQNVSRKIKGSANRLKAKKLLAKAHLKISRQREEYAKRCALRLCQSNDLIAYEALNVKGMVKGLFSKAISDVGWGLFLKWLKYFAAKLGRKTVAVNPRGTSQRCSNCGIVVTKTLADRTHSCSCGLLINRDINSAINILKLSTQGRWETQAYGEGTATLFGENLVEQVLSVK